MLRESASSTVSPVRAQPRSLMAAEMAETPVVLHHLLGTRPGLFDALRRAPRPLAGIVLLGRGSSEYAARYGRHLLELTTGRPAALLPPDRSGPTRRDSYRGYLAVGVSPSGETEEIVDGLAELRRAGALTVGLTARISSPLSSTADIVVDLCSGIERSVQATKTFVASLAGLALLADVLGDGIWSLSDWRRLIASIEALLDDPLPAARAAARLQPGDHIACVGQGLLRPVAGDAALKLRTAAQLTADAHWQGSGSEGPVAGTDQRRPVIGFADLAPDGDDTRRLLEGVVRLGGGPTILVDQAPGADVPLPADVRPALLPPAAALRAQQLALAAALQHGLNPETGPSPFERKA